MWSTLNKPIPGTPTLNPAKFAALLTCIALLPGLSHVILVFLVVGWCLAWALRILPTDKAGIPSQRTAPVEMSTSPILINER